MRHRLPNVQLPGPESTHPNLFATFQHRRFPYPMRNRPSNAMKTPAPEDRRMLLCQLCILLSVCAIMHFSWNHSTLVPFRSCKWMSIRRLKRAFSPNFEVGAFLGTLDRIGADWCQYRSLPALLGMIIGSSGSPPLEIIDRSAARLGGGEWTEITASSGFETKPAHMMETVPALVAVARSGNLVALKVALLAVCWTTNLIDLMAVGLHRIMADRHQQCNYGQNRCLMCLWIKHYCVVVVLTGHLPSAMTASRSVDAE